MTISHHKELSQGFKEYGDFASPGCRDDDKGLIRNLSKVPESIRPILQVFFVIGDDENRGVRCCSLRRFGKSALRTIYEPST